MGQNGNTIKVLYGNIVISGIIECITGLHIGGSSDSIEIGGIDSPILKNPLTGYPYIPGSSLKGKLRSIVEKFVKKNGNYLQANRHTEGKVKIYRHECDDLSQAIECPLCRVFGATGKGSDKDSWASLILVSDGKLHNVDKLVQDDLPIIEAKTENTIDRLTSAAVPRTFERVPAGAEFTFEIIYRVEFYNLNGNTPELDKSRVKTDISNIIDAMALLEKDGLGGNISRGYGKIKFKVNELKGYGPDNSDKGGFKDPANPIDILSCKTKLDEIEFTKTN